MSRNTVRLSSAAVKERQSILYNNPEILNVYESIARRKDTLKGLYQTKRDLRSQGKFAHYQLACVKTEIAILEHELERLHARKAILLGDKALNGLDPEDDYSTPF